MPAIILLLVMLGLAGGVQVSSSDLPEAESAVLVGGQFGGIVDPESGEVRETELNIIDAVTSEESVESETVILPPVIDTYSPQDLQTTRATLRGELTHVSDPYRGSIYFVFSESFQDVVTISDDAYFFSVSKRSSKQGVMTEKISRLNQDQRYYYRLCFEASERTCGDVVSFSTNEARVDPGSYDRPSVTTKKAENIGAESVDLYGTYRLNDAENTILFFVYGEDKDRITEVPSEYTEYSDVREFDEDLQKERVGVNVESSGSRIETIDDLEKETVYYHRFCVAYDDDDATGIRCGSVRSFETKDKDRNIPLVRTQSVTVGGDRASFAANIDMRDFLNGYAFLVYGTSESRVAEIPSRNEFGRITQRGDALQRVAIDTDFDGRSDVETSVSDLIAAQYYYSFCVEYETEDDRGRDDTRITCGDIESFSIN